MLLAYLLMNAHRVPGLDIFMDIWVNIRLTGSEEL